MFYHAIPPLFFSMSTRGSSGTITDPSQATV